MTRLASSNLRAFHPPIDHLVHDFIINLGVNLGGQGNVQLFLGNPGDYAWGREGLDAIVTQLLNQMDTSGSSNFFVVILRLELLFSRTATRLKSCYRQSSGG